MFDGVFDSTFGKAEDLLGLRASLVGMVYKGLNTCLDGLCDLGQDKVFEGALVERGEDGSTTASF
jgi:ketol-acid reductoisomerase